MAGSFDDAWDSVNVVRDGSAPSERLRPLLARVYVAIGERTVDLRRLRTGLVELLTYLAGPGRTHANLRATDHFFAVSDGWERDWIDADLPDDVHDLLADMGGALHDAVTDPRIARQYQGLPEQLLERAARLRIPSDPD